MSPDSNDKVRPLLVVVLVCCTFFYFLIFAQFGFLHRLENIESRSNLIELAMLAMGTGGIAGSVVVARRYQLEKAKYWIHQGFIGCGLAGVGAIIITNIWLQLIIAMSVGYFLGTLTVAIVPLLRALLPSQRIGLSTSIAVGGAYFICNIPVVFRCSAEDHCLLGALSCCVGVLAVSRIPKLNGDLLARDEGSKTQPHLFRTKGVWVVTFLFLGLIWIDSAAFYLIQSSEKLRVLSWDTDLQLWRNASVHFLAAIAGGWVIDQGKTFMAMILSFAFLEIGAWLLQEVSGMADLATILYICGVSIYSTALVAYGALAPELVSNWSVSKRAGMVFAIGGWFGSAMGIGMAKDLNRVPLGFLVVAAIVAIACTSIHWSLKNSPKELAG